MTTTCTRCRRAADPDTELLVVVLGVPMCSACAEQKAEEMDRVMSDRQIGLARHALGLPNKARKSYRNYFVTGAGSTDHPDWEAMVVAGFASRMGPLEIFGGDYCYHLTRAGADAALQEGERLCREDFPDRATDKAEADRMEVGNVR